MKYAIISDGSWSGDISVITEDGGYAEIRNRENVEDDSKDKAVIDYCLSKISLTGELDLDGLLDTSKWMYDYLHYEIADDTIDDAIKKALSFLVCCENVTFERDDSIIENLTFKGNGMNKKERRDEEMDYMQPWSGQTFLDPIVKDGVCQHTKLQLGRDTGFKDKSGNVIYENSLLLDIDNSIAEIVDIEYEDRVEYYISNSHCSACPIIQENLQVIGILDNDKNRHMYLNNIGYDGASCDF